MTKELSPLYGIILPKNLDPEVAMGTKPSAKQWLVQPKRGPGPCMTRAFTTGLQAAAELTIAGGVSSCILRIKGFISIR